VARIATRDFSFLRGSQAVWRIRLGDARLSLERETAAKFDVLVVDAFAGDAIPTHLLTREAFALYWRRLTPDGVLVINTSNRYLDLAPLVAAEAAADGKEARLVINDADQTSETYAAYWVLITSRPGFFTDPALSSARPILPRPGLRPWTDDYSSLLPLLR
jgi:spermidine synthase